MSNQQKWDRQTAQALPDMEVTHFHFLRHGRVETGGKRLVYGHLDLPLSDEGQLQGQRLIEFSQANVPQADGVLSSDLQRCLNIARPLTETLGLPLEVLPALREQHMGQWEGRSWAELTGKMWRRCAPIGLIMRTLRLLMVRVSDLVERFANYLSTHMEKLKGRRWIVVAHTGIVRAALCHLMGLPPSEGLRFAPLPGTHTWLIWAESGAVIQTLGERPRSMSFGAAGAIHSGEARKQGAVRLAFSGSAGTGKTTLGQSLAEHWGFLSFPKECVLG